MTRSNAGLTPEGRDRAQARLRRLTRTAVLAATGAAAVIGVVVAREHPGSSSASTVSDTTSTSSTTTSTSSTSTSTPSDGSSSTTTPSTTTTTVAPTPTHQRSQVTSGGTSR